MVSSTWFAVNARRKRSLSKEFLFSKVGHPEVNSRNHEGIAPKYTLQIRCIKPVFTSGNDWGGQTTDSKSKRGILFGWIEKELTVR